MVLEDLCQVCCGVKLKVGGRCEFAKRCKCGIVVNLRGLISGKSAPEWSIYVGWVFLVSLAAPKRISFKTHL